MNLTKAIAIARALSGASSSSGGGGSGGVKVTYGSITPTEEIRTGTVARGGLTIEHGLGVPPDFFIIGLYNKNTVRNAELSLFVYRSGPLTYDGTPAYYVLMGNSAGDNWTLVDIRNNSFYPVSETEITVCSYSINSIAPFIATQEYKWVAIGGLSE